MATTTKQVPSPRLPVFNNVQAPFGQPEVVPAKWLAVSLFENQISVRMTAFSWLVGLLLASPLLGGLLDTGANHLCRMPSRRRPGWSGPCKWASPLIVIGQNTPGGSGDCRQMYQAVICMPYAACCMPWVVGNREAGNR